MDNGEIKRMEEREGERGIEDNGWVRERQDKGTGYEVC